MEIDSLRTFQPYLEAPRTESGLHCVKCDAYKATVGCFGTRSRYLKSYSIVVKYTCNMCLLHSLSKL